MDKIDTFIKADQKVIEENCEEVKSYNHDKDGYNKYVLARRPDTIGKPIENSNSGA